MYPHVFLLTGYQPKDGGTEGSRDRRMDEWMNEWTKRNLFYFWTNEQTNEWMNEA